MAKPKKGSWTPQETSLVDGLPKDAKLHGKLVNISKKLNRPYANVYQKWHSLHNKEKIFINPNVTAMSFKIEKDYDGSRTTVSDIEIKSMQLGLDVAIKSLEPGRGAVIIPTRLQKHAKSYLEKISPNSFTFHGIKDNAKCKRVMRRV